MHYHSRFQASYGSSQRCIHTNTSTLHKINFTYPLFCISSTIYLHIFYLHIHNSSRFQTSMGVRRPVFIYIEYRTLCPNGCLQLQVAFRRRVTDYRALLRKEKCKVWAWLLLCIRWTIYVHVCTVIRHFLSFFLSRVMNTQVFKWTKSRGYWEPNESWHPMHVRHPVFVNPFPLSWT